jgi:hypothetical protein
LSGAGEVTDAGVAELLDFGAERVAGEIGVDAVDAARFAASTTTSPASVTR